MIYKTYRQLREVVEEKTGKMPDRVWFIFVGLSCMNLHSPFDDKDVDSFVDNIEKAKRCLIFPELSEEELMKREGNYESFLGDAPGKQKHSKTRINATNWDGGWDNCVDIVEKSR